MVVPADGTRDALGLWAGEGAKYWLRVFTPNRTAAWTTCYYKQLFRLTT